MKKLLLFLLLFLSVSAISQNYQFSKKLEYINNELISNTKGDFELKFETTDKDYLCTMYHNRIIQTWLFLIKTKEYTAVNSETFSKEHYFNTKSSSIVILLRSSDNNKIIISNYGNNQREEYYK